MTFKHIISAILSFLVLFTASCGDNTEFTITGTVEGKPNMNLYFRYYAGESARNGITLVKEGNFEYRGVSRQPTVVEVMDNEGKVLGRAYVANGQTIDMKINRQNPYKTQVKGSPENEQWSGWLNSNADSLLAFTPQQFNAAIEQFVGQNNTQISSALLFLTSYTMWLDPVKADSIGQSIAPEARPSALFGSFSALMAPYSSGEAVAPVDTLLFRTRDSDSTYVFTPDPKKNTLIAISNEKTPRGDSLVSQLKELHTKGKAQVIDIMLTSDTMTWKRSIRQDSAKWIQGWAPGTLFAKGIDKLALPQLPYFLVLDTVGRQIYRTPYISNALEQF